MLLRPGLRPRFQWEMFHRPACRPLLGGEGTERKGREAAEGDDEGNCPHGSALPEMRFPRGSVDYFVSVSHIYRPILNTYSLLFAYLFTKTESG